MEVIWLVTWCVVLAIAGAIVRHLVIRGPPAGERFAGQAHLARGRG